MDLVIGRPGGVCLMTLHWLNAGFMVGILPKGVSFDMLTQAQAYLALSHVNAYVRGSQGNRTPFEVFEFLYGKGTAAKLHIDHIDPKEVILKPRLVGIEIK